MATPSPSGFTQIWNALIVDRRLTATAFRIAAYLGSKPEDWTAREHDIRNALGLGHDSYLEQRCASRSTREMSPVAKRHGSGGASGPMPLGLCEPRLSRSPVSTDSGSPVSGNPTGYQY